MTASATIEVCAHCHRVERRCACPLYEAETVSLSPTPPRPAPAPAPPARSPQAHAPAGRRNARAKRTMLSVVPPPETDLETAERALAGATPQNLAGPHELVEGTWFTYIKGLGWQFTVET